MADPNVTPYPSRLGDPEGHLRRRNAEIAEMFKHIAQYWFALAGFVLDPQYDYPFDLFLLSCISKILGATTNTASMMLVLVRSNEQVTEYMKYASKLAEDASGPMTEEIENWLKSLGPDGSLDTGLSPDAGQS